MTFDDLLNQLVLTRAGRVGTVTKHSDGWLVLDDQIDDAVLPSEVAIVSADWSDETLKTTATKLGLDPLQIDSVPDLVRKAMSAKQYAYSALQCIPHPTIDKAYVVVQTITDDGQYDCVIKPEKGSKFNLTLTEEQLKRFESEGILPSSEQEQAAEELQRLKTELAKRNDELSALKAELGDLKDKLNLTEKALLETMAEKGKIAPEDPAPVSNETGQSSQSEKKTKTIIQKMRGDRPDHIRAADTQKDRLEESGHILMSEFVDTVVVHGVVWTYRTLRFEYEEIAEPVPDKPDKEDTVEAEAITAETQPDEIPDPVPELEVPDPATSIIGLEPKDDILNGLPIASAMREHGLEAVIGAMDEQVILSLKNFADSLTETSPRKADPHVLPAPNITIEVLS